MGIDMFNEGVGSVGWEGAVPGLGLVCQELFIHTDDGEVKWCSIIEWVFTLGFYI